MEGRTAYEERERSLHTVKSPSALETCLCVGVRFLILHTMAHQFLGYCSCCTLLITLSIPNGVEIIQIIEMTMLKLLTK